MAYSTTKIVRRNLVKLAGWGMTGLRPPGRGNLRDAQASSMRPAESQASTVQVCGNADEADPITRA